MNSLKPSSSSRRAVFLDRDGVLNYKMPEPDYVCSWEQFRFIPGAIDAALELQRAGFLLFVVTNQRGIARSKISADELHALHARMLAAMAECDVRIAKIYVCPHEGGCECRKPRPGMLLDAAREFGLSLRQSWMIGDSLSDIDAGRRAGCRTLLISTGADHNPRPRLWDLRASNLQDAANQILLFCPTSTFKAGQLEKRARKSARFRPV